MLIVKRLSPLTKNSWLDALSIDFSDYITLDTLHYQHFARSVTKNNFNLAILPPTSNVA